MWDNPKEWIKKDKELAKKKPKKVPDVHSYKPHPVTYHTFGVDLENFNPKKKRPGTFSYLVSANDNKMFGT
jgi:hypothetical protein